MTWKIDDLPDETWHEVKDALGEIRDKINEIIQSVPKESELGKQRDQQQIFCHDVVISSSKGLTMIAAILMNIRAPYTPWLEHIEKALKESEHEFIAIGTR